MEADYIDDDAPILQTRIPQSRAVSGLQYGAHVTQPGWDGYYIRPLGCGRWGVARQTPAADELELDDEAIVGAIRAELGA